MTIIHEYKPVSQRGRLRYAFIDAAIFCVVWMVTINVANVTPPALAMMSRYTPEQYRDYIYAVSVMSVILLVNSVIMHWKFGGSVGKILMKCRTYRQDGSKLSFGNAVARALFCFGVALSILAPGPIVAAIFGTNSDHFAIGLLCGGILFWLWVMVQQDREPSTLHETWLGIQTVKVK
ncbi:MAG: RDD family protein [Beijerinckiaceae bacterium]